MWFEMRVEMTRWALIRVSKGLWSVIYVNLCPKRYEWNLLTPKKQASLSDCISAQQLTMCETKIRKVFLYHLVDDERGQQRFHRLMHHKRGGELPFLDQYKVNSSFANLNACFSSSVHFHLVNKWSSSDSPVTRLSSR